ERRADADLLLDPAVFFVRVGAVDLEEHAETPAVHGSFVTAVAAERLERGTRDERDVAASAIDRSAGRRLHESQRVTGPARKRLRPGPVDHVSLDRPPVEVRGDLGAELDPARGG